MKRTIRQIDPAKLRAAREAVGLSQVEAARRLGLEKYQLSQYESGHARPIAGTYLDLATLYSVQPEDLLTEVDDFRAFSTRKSLTV